MKARQLYWSIALLLMFASCGDALTQGTARDSSNASVEYSPSEGPANQYDHFISREATNVIEGVVLERTVMKSKEDPHKPSYEKDFVHPKNQAEKDAEIAAMGEVPIMRWEVRVTNKDKGPQIDRMTETIFVTATAEDDDLKRFKQDGAFPEEYEEVAPQRALELLVVDDEFIRRGAKKNQYSYFLLVGWRVL